MLLKAGTNSLGVITLTSDNWFGEFGADGDEPHFIAGVACYVVSLIVWILGLSRVPVSVAYPLLSVGYVINAIGAYYLLGEALTAAALDRHRLHHPRRVARGAQLARPRR